MSVDRAMYSVTDPEAITNFEPTARSINYAAPSCTLICTSLKQVHYVLEDYGVPVTLGELRHHFEMYGATATRTFGRFIVQKQYPNA